MEQSQDIDTLERKEHSSSDLGITAANGRSGAANREKASGQRHWSARQSLCFPHRGPYIGSDSEGATTPANTGQPADEEKKL